MSIRERKSIEKSAVYWEVQQNRKTNVFFGSNRSPSQWEASLLDLRAEHEQTARRLVTSCRAAGTPGGMRPAFDPFDLGRFNWRRHMVKSSRVQLIAVLAIGGLLGYAAASSRLDVFGNVDAGPSHQAVAGQTANSAP